MSSARTAPANKKNFSSTLDRLEFGTGTERTRSMFSLPDGIENRMVYLDILRLAWPSLIEFTLSQLTSMVDMMMVGQLGAWALTSVGLASQPKFSSCRCLCP